VYINKIKQVASFFEKNKKDDILFCPACHIEHTGRNAYSIKIFLYLYEKTGEKYYFDFAYSVVKNIMNKLKYPPESNGKYKVFYPGLYGGSQNNASNVIESGISTDMVAEFLLFCKNKKIEILEYQKWFNELYDHIYGYLFEASLSKSCLNQRLWGLSGIATFYKLTKDSKLKLHIQESLKKFFSEQNSDGSFNYIVNKKSIDAQFSLYYFSRVLTFAQYCMEAVNDFSYKKQMKKALILLIDCYDEKYNKILALESKKWFFTASYEIESLSYDIFLMKTYKMDDVCEKQISFYFEHINENGVNSNLEKKPNLSCAFIDNSDFVWFIRALEVQKYQEFNYVKVDRIYKDAGIEIKFQKEYKEIRYFKQELFNSNWGSMNNLKVQVYQEKTYYIFPRHYYKFALHPRLKINLANLRNILKMSKYNLDYFGVRKRYIVKKIFDTLKYDLLLNGYK